MHSYLTYIDYCAGYIVFQIRLCYYTHNSYWIKLGATCYLV